jgi:hypothetical protein
MPGLVIDVVTISGSYRSVRMTTMLILLEAELKYTVIYLITLSVSESVQHQSSWMTVRHELEKRWKEEIIAFILSILPAFFRDSAK